MARLEKKAGWKRGWTAELTLGQRRQFGTAGTAKAGTGSLEP